MLHGNPGKRPLPQGEPKPALEVYEPPPHLGDLAQAEWSRLFPELYRLQILTVVDRAVFAAYCAAYERWVLAEQELRSAQALLTATEIGGLKVHPYVTVANAAMGLMHKFMVELGLTPSSRVRLAKGKPEEVDALDAFLAKKKGRR